MPNTIKIFSTIIVFMATAFTAMAQTQAPPTNKPHKDTLINREIKYWEKKLQLNKKQTDDFAKAYKRDIKTTDSIMRLRYNDSTLKKEKRKEFLKAERKEHRKQLKAILTKKQWEEYTAERKKQQAIMEERMQKAGKKIMKDKTDKDDD